MIKSYLIGRSKDCDIVLTAPTVGRRHAELISDSATDFVLVDRESTNGTFLWDHGKWQRITTMRVGLTDKVKLGDFETTIQKLYSSKSTSEAPAKTSHEDKHSKKLPRRPVIERNPETGEIISRQKK